LGGERRPKAQRQGGDFTNNFSIYTYTYMPSKHLHRVV